jgi:hypothetical protein
LQTATFLSGTVWQAIAALATTTNVAKMLAARVMMRGFRLIVSLPVQGA